MLWAWPTNTDTLFSILTFSNGHIVMYSFSSSYKSHFGTWINGWRISTFRGSECISCGICHYWALYTLKLYPACFQNSFFVWSVHLFFILFYLTFFCGRNIVPWNSRKMRNKSLKVAFLAVLNAILCTCVCV